MCGCSGKTSSTKAGSPSGIALAGSGEVVIWMHKPGMSFSQKIIAMGAFTGRTIFFVQDRTIAVDLADFDSLKNTVEASGGMLFKQPDWAYLKSTVSISAFTAPSGVSYSFAPGFTRPVLLTDIDAIQAAYSTVLSS